MENKINLVELLKDCPKGMELYSPIYGFGLLTKVTNKIHVKFPKEHNVKCFRLDGKVSEDGEIMLFPKGKTTWEGFVPPCKFKDGDILVHTQNERLIISIYHNKVTESIIKTHCILWDKDEGLSVNKEICCYSDYVRLATEEEKEKLFQSIKDNGYKWNAETKTLETLVKPTFKVGDRIRSGKNCDIHISNVIITEVGRCGYHGVIGDTTNKAYISFKHQDYYELIPNKFDINTLKPFESRVLVRDYNSEIWRVSFWGCLLDNKEEFKYDTVRGNYKQCIPYEGNEHLLGKTNDCNYFYKTWNN